MRVCRHGHSLTVDNVYRNARGIDECRACRTAARRKYYDSHLWQTKARARAQTSSKRRFLKAVKTTCGCIDCGRTDGLLHFDHRPGTAKAFNLAHTHAAGWARIVEEMAKCDVRCASCHAKRHRQYVA